jgi:hypothetical protein
MLTEAKIHAVRIDSKYQGALVRTIDRSAVSNAQRPSISNLTLVGPNQNHACQPPQSQPQQQQQQQKRKQSRLLF